MTDAFTQRRGGILLHPTALPGPHGIGDLGPMAYRFVDLLEATGRFCHLDLPPLAALPTSLPLHLPAINC